jgi:ABC-type glutathione transport system ATPase component
MDQDTDALDPRAAVLQPGRLSEIARRYGAPPLAIEVRGLRKIYAGTRTAPAKEALKGIDLEVPRGSIFGLLGPNGAGKSTLINILAGLVIKSAGAVRIWDFDIDLNPRRSRRAIGIVPQELNLDAFFTPRETLEIQAGLYGVPRSERRSDEILAALGLADKAGVYPARCPAACAGGSWSPRRWSTSRRSWCSTSRPRASTSSSGAASGATCASSTSRA